MPEKVVVAMSGGVDSSVAAALLQEQGFVVSGMFMKNWSPEDNQSLTDCPWEQDQADAAAVCQHLGIPFRSINFEKEYRERVVDYFLREYAAGRTPNPDIMCNKEIKFAAFLKAAHEMGADYIATGHYARIEQRDGRYRLLRGVDASKDQSYFLYTLRQEQLSRALFPLGELKKSEVRDLATRFDLPTAQKKDSQGICFIGHIDLKKFLMEHIAAKPGLTYLAAEYKEGEALEARLARSLVVGKHQGAMFYTLGERAGAVVDNGCYRAFTGGADVPPLYVLAKDAEKNALYVTAQADDRHFFTQRILLEGWEPSDVSPGGTQAQVRYRQQNLPEVEAVEVQEDGRVEVRTLVPLQAVAAGQSLVLYDGEAVAGGGIISEVK
jgi:tRNA-uridine 2-sulfurtransferase